LETVCPDIAADFDVDKNGVTAAEVTSSAHTKYSWLSDEPGARNELLISAQLTQGEGLSLKLGAHDHAANRNACRVFRLWAG